MQKKKQHNWNTNPSRTKIHNRYTKALYTHPEIPSQLETKTRFRTFPAKAPDAQKQAATSNQTPADSTTTQARPASSPPTLCHAIDKIIPAARRSAPGSMAHLSLFKPHVPPFVGEAKSGCSDARVQGRRLLAASDWAGSLRIRNHGRDTRPVSFAFPVD